MTSEQLIYLRSFHFTWTDIASLLGVSRMTIFRRRQENGLLNDPTETIDDSQLRMLLSHLRRSSPQLGETMMMGHLRSLGYNVPRARVCSAIRATDPINTALQWQGSITSRWPYSVPGPNSLWHIGKVLHPVYKCRNVNTLTFYSYYTPYWLLCPFFGPFLFLRYKTPVFVCQFTVGTGFCNWIRQFCS